MSTTATDDPAALAATFKALSDPARLAILDFLAAPDPTCCANDGAVCACDLEAPTGLSQPTVSHHMRILVEAGLVRSEKRGRWMHYEVEPAGFDRARRAIDAFVEAGDASFAASPGAEGSVA